MPSLGPLLVLLGLSAFLIYGTWALVQGIELRRTGKAMDPAVGGTGPADSQPSTAHNPFRRPAHQ